MKTKVINIKTQAKPNTEYVYIGRGSKWGNPYTHIDLRYTKAEEQVSTREESVERYKEWIMKQPELLKQLKYLKGRTLGCYCKPMACHGDILAELADQLKGGE